MSNEKWLKDLEQGEWGESIIADFFIKRGWYVEYNPNKNSDYDLILKKGGKRISLEIKTDRWEFFNKKITNNIFLEVSHRGKPSGIMSSADYFIYFFPDWGLFYVISMKRARQLVQFGTRKSYSGDGGRVVGWTINRFDFKDWFKIVKI